MQFLCVRRQINLESMNGANETLINLPFFGRALTLQSSFGRLWCTWTHRSPMWPIKGRYQCAKCFRYHPVPWENGSTGNYCTGRPPRYRGRLPKGLSQPELLRILGRLRAIEGDGIAEQPTMRTRLRCGHEDEIRLGINPNHTVCSQCRANGIRPDREPAD